jgi:phosphate:Na+ symporter
MAELSVSMALLHLLGGVAILLWGLRMVRTAATRGLGGQLRVLLLRVTRSQPKAFLFGSGASFILQSSTAAILLLASFVGKGFITLPAALAAALGADLGTALAVQVLRLDLAFAAPAAALLGYVLFRLAGSKRLKNIGRALLGLGFILVALKLIVGASAPMRSSEVLVDALGALSNEPVLAVLLAAALTWLSHSSLAVVLLIAALASSGVIGGTLGLALIGGVNLGAALPAVLATSASPPCERRVAVGNLVFRGCGVLLLLPFIAPAQEIFDSMDLSAGATVAMQHLAFNVLLAILALPLTHPAARLLNRLVPERPETLFAAMQMRGPRRLDDAALLSPEQAIANAQREALRMADRVYDMVECSISAFDMKAGVEASAISALDDQVDAFNNSIKFYLAEIARKELSPEESARCMKIFNFVTNMEHIGDVVDGNVMKLAERMRKTNRSFSKEGRAEIEALHARIVANLQMATNVFMSDDEDLAEHLIEEKRTFRDLDRDATQRHLERLRLGNAVSMETSSIHVDLLRDLRRINSHAAAIAYSVLDAPLSSPRHAS